MKLLKVVCLLVCCIIADSKFLPKRLPKFCPQTHEKYNDCTKKVLRELAPHLLQGVREIDFPAFNPLEIPLFIVNRTFAENVYVNAILKNIKMWGFENATLKDFKFDVNTLSGQLHIAVPVIRVESDVEVSGQLNVIKMNNAGHVFADFLGNSYIFKFLLKQTKSLGVKYYTVEDMKVRSGLENVKVNLQSQSPDVQALNELNVRLFQLNPRPFIEAALPILDESAAVFLKAVLERTLAKIPAEDLLPE